MYPEDHEQRVVETRKPVWVVVTQIIIKPQNWIGAAIVLLLLNAVTGGAVVSILNPNVNSTIEATVSSPNQNPDLLDQLSSLLRPATERSWENLTVAEMRTGNLQVVVNNIPALMGTATVEEAEDTIESHRNRLITLFTNAESTEFQRGVSEEVLWLRAAVNEGWPYAKEAVSDVIASFDIAARGNLSREGADWIVRTVWVINEFGDMPIEGEPYHGLTGSQIAEALRNDWAAAVEATDLQQAQARQQQLLEEQQRQHELQLAYAQQTQTASDLATQTAIQQSAAVQQEQKQQALPQEKPLPAVEPEINEFPERDPGVETNPSEAAQQVPNEPPVSETRTMDVNALPDRLKEQFVVAGKPQGFGWSAVLSLWNLRHVQEALQGMGPSEWSTVSNWYVVAVMDEDFTLFEGGPVLFTQHIIFWGETPDTVPFRGEEGPLSRGYYHGYDGGNYWWAMPITVGAESYSIGDYVTHTDLTGKVLQFLGVQTNKPTP